MQPCPNCGNEVPDEADVCLTCGTDLSSSELGSPTATRNADYDPEAERKRFEQRYGIDIGDRSVQEYLEHLGQQDYSTTPWFWLIVGSELLGIGLFLFDLFGRGDHELGLQFLFPALSVLLGLSILADTRTVGQFRRWARIRWTYVALAVVPLVGHIAGFLYLLLRRLKHEQTTKYRRRLIDAGIDLDTRSDDG